MAARPSIERMKVVFMVKAVEMALCLVSWTVGCLFKMEGD